MTRTYGIFLIFMGCFVAQAIANPQLDSVAVETPKPTQDGASHSQELLAKAEMLLKETDFELGKQGYQTLLADPQLSSAAKAVIQKYFDTYKWALILSKKQTPHSTFYEVVSGDNLTKIAKRHGTTVGLIKRVNHLKSDTIYAGMKLKIITGSFSIRVDKSDNDMILFLEDERIKYYQIATGRGGNTPEGTFKIINKITDPTWYKEGQIIPPGDPENNLGSRWLGFDKKSYGIHGTTEPESIGKAVSAGCIRMHNHEVEELAEIIPVGVQVIVTA